MYQPEPWSSEHLRSSAAAAAHEGLVTRFLAAHKDLPVTEVRHRTARPLTVAPAPPAPALRAACPEPGGPCAQTTPQGPAAAPEQAPDVFASHEGLLLPYEEALTRPAGDAWYNLGAHLLWIGDRTRQLDGAHVGACRAPSRSARRPPDTVHGAAHTHTHGAIPAEYFRGLANPVGLKVGPTLSPDELVALARCLNPANEPCKLTLITRYGASQVRPCTASAVAAALSTYQNG